MVEDLSDVIFELSAAQGPSQPNVITITRTGYASAPDATGNMPEVPGESFTATASVQPGAGRQLELQPEGGDAAEDVTLYLVPDRPDRVILPTDRAAKRRGDYVTLGDGQTYEVVEAHDWRATAGYYHCVVRRRHE